MSFTFSISGTKIPAQFVEALSGFGKSPEDFHALRRGFFPAGHKFTTEVNLHLRFEWK